jgi:hypothetical protein
MTVQPNYVNSLFANLENGNSDAFFEHVADDINWTVMGTHPLAGDYHSKADFLTHLRPVGQDSQGGRDIVCNQRSGRWRQCCGGNGIAFHSAQRKAF